MNESILERVRGANAKMRSLLTRIHDALAGKSTFDGRDVRTIGEPLGQMGQILEEAKQLREMDPVLDGELEMYAGNLGEMQVALERMRFMLIAQRAHIEAMRGHLETLGLWSATLRMTR